MSPYITLFQFYDFKAVGDYSVPLAIAKLKEAV